MGKKDWLFLAVGILLLFPLLVMLPAVFLPEDGGAPIPQTYDVGAIGNSIIALLGGVGLCVCGCVGFKKRRHRILLCSAIAIGVSFLVISLFM